MPIENWDQIQDLFLAAADLPRDEQARFLDARCGTDKTLRREVESLLASDRTPAENIVAAVEGEAQSLIGFESIIGARLGAYRVTAEIGRGGMGAVYRAVRDDDQYRKQAAIKLVKHGMDTAEVLARFRRERQILANLDHPYIARLIDGGAFRDGRPFFVMEYVDGRSIDVYCRERNLDIRQRCELFLKVCEAVSYAHRNLVVHRDLKPGNIFVTPEGTPKLLDFGVAKLLAPDADPAVTATVAHIHPLTPAYASPEQVRGQPVNTGTDVYSLGAVLYELLTGSKARQIQSSTAAELERTIREAEVSPPSAAAGVWRKQVAGDLDNIVRMAMRNEPERRYPSVDQLAEDIRRYLDGRPILARKDSLRYRAGKFLSRRRYPLAAAAIVFASLLTGVIVAMSQARQAEAARRLAESQHAIAGRERDGAVRERARAEMEARNARTEEQRAEQRLSQMVELANHLLFDVHDTVERLSGATEARREIVRTTLQFLEKLAQDAGPDERLRLALSAAYLRLGDVQGYPFTPNLGDSAGALKSYREASALIEPLRVQSGDHPQVLMQWIDIQRKSGTILDTNGDSAGAVKAFRDALPAARLLARLKPLEIDAVKQEGLLYEGLATALEEKRAAEAIVYARKHLATFAALAAAHPGNSEVLDALSSAHARVGSVLSRGDLPGALEEYRKCVAVREALVAAHPNDVVFRRMLMIGYGHVAAVLGNPFVYNLGDSQGAREYYGKALAIAKDISKRDSQDRTAQYDLASALLRVGAIDVPAAGRQESLAMLRESGEILVPLAKADPKMLRYKRTLSVAYEYTGRRLQEMGKRSEAMAEFRRSLDIAEGILATNPDDMSTRTEALTDVEAIAQLLAEQGDRSAALNYARQGIGRAEGYLSTGVDHVSGPARIPKSYFALGSVYRALAKSEQQTAAQRVADWREARAAAGRAISEWSKLTAAGEKHPYARDIAKAEALLAESEAELR